MKATKKKQYTGRKTNMFYAVMAQLPNYSKEHADLIKEGLIHDFLERHYGKNHGRSLRLTSLTDMEFSELLQELQQQVNTGKNIPQLQSEAIRKKLVHQILATFSRIGITASGGDYTVINDHIRRLPISKGRIIPQFRFNELDSLLGAVRAYCGNIQKKQQKERMAAAKN